MIRERFGLDDVAEADLVEELQLGSAEHIELDLAVPKALDQARGAGWVTVVVTNGTVRQQERKLRHTGLAGHVEGWVISEGAGIRKPDPAIFELAARQVGRTLDGAWMIGDSPEADIGGAYRAGLSSVWLHRGRTWATAEFAPTRIADSCSQAIAAVLAGPG
jgi:putative hydrolase of the HAD superfamily